MKTTKRNCLLKYLYWIALFILAYFLFRFILDKYNETQKIEEFSGGIPMIKGVDNAGNYVLWGFVIFCVMGLIVFFSKKIHNKRLDNRIQKAAKDLLDSFEKIDEEKKGKTSK